MAWRLVIAKLPPRSKVRPRRALRFSYSSPPRYVLAEASAGQHIRKAPFKNHTDLELMIIETLVGRTPPFAFIFDRYDRLRKDY